jgi:Double zinc ribbon
MPKGFERLTVYCTRCGSQLPDDAAFCYRCGSAISPSPATQAGVGRATATSVSSSGPSRRREVIAPSGVVSLKCPSCGAPVSPRFGEMIIMCEYCGGGVTLGREGWTNVQRHTMLPLKVTDRAVAGSTIHALMNEGLLRWHVWERSTLEELTLSYVPYWIISVSARTSIVAVDTTAQIAAVAATAAILGTAAAGGGNIRHRGRGNALDAAILGGVVGGRIGRAGAGASTKAYQLDENHNYPVVALRAFRELQPHDFEFALQERELFEPSKLPKDIKVLNGDVGEDDAKQQARTLVDQLQSQKAHERYRMIQQIKTEIDVGDAELLHVPVWVGRYLFKGTKKIVVIVDANSGSPIHAIGLDD